MFVLDPKRIFGKLQTVLAALKPQQHSRRIGTKADDKGQRAEPKSRQEGNALASPSGVRICVSKVLTFLAGRKSAKPYKQQIA